MRIPKIDAKLKTSEEKDMAENRRDNQQEDSDSSSGGEAEEQWRRTQTVGKRQQKPCPLDG